MSEKFDYFLKKFRYEEGYLAALEKVLKIMKTHEKREDIIDLVSKEIDKCAERTNKIRV